MCPRWFIRSLFLLAHLFLSRKAAGWKALGGIGLEEGHSSPITRLRLSVGYSNVYSSDVKMVSLQLRARGAMLHIRFHLLSLNRILARSICFLHCYILDQNLDATVSYSFLYNLCGIEGTALWSMNCNKSKMRTNVSMPNLWGWRANSLKHILRLLFLFAIVTLRKPKLHIVICIRFLLGNCVLNFFTNFANWGSSLWNFISKIRNCRGQCLKIRSHGLFYWNHSIDFFWKLCFIAADN